MTGVDFAYLACSVMHFYGVGYGELLQLPISVFWALSENIDRLRAEEDLRQYELIGNAVGGGDNAKAYISRLERQRSEIVKIEDPSMGFDRDGLNKIRMLMMRGR